VITEKYDLNMSLEKVEQRSRARESISPDGRSWVFRVSGATATFLDFTVTASPGVNSIGLWLEILIPSLHCPEGFQSGDSV